MRTLVTYFSRTGNTRRVAEAIFDAIGGEKDLRELAQVDGLDAYGLTFLGFPIEERFAPAEPAATFLAGRAAFGRPVALFVTHGAPDDLPELPGWLRTCAASASRAVLVGLFHCQGELSEPTAERMLHSGDPRIVGWAKTRAAGVGQPDAASLQRARQWARAIVDARRSAPYAGRPGRPETP